MSIRLPPFQHRAEGGGGVRLPPSPIDAAIRALPWAKFGWALAVLAAPLALAIVILIFVIHSAFLAALVDATLAWLSFLYFQAWQLYGSTPVRLSASTRALHAVHLPLLLAAVTLRLIVQWGISNYLPHTSERKKRAVTASAVGYIALLYFTFHDIVTTASSLRAAGSDSDDSRSSAVSSAFASIYWRSLLLTILGAVSSWWVPTSNGKLHAAERKLLLDAAAATDAAGAQGSTDGNSKDGSGSRRNQRGKNGTSNGNTDLTQGTAIRERILKQQLTQHYKAHIAYIVLQAAAEEDVLVNDAGSGGKREENEGSQNDERQLRHRITSTTGTTDTLSRHVNDSSSLASSSSLPAVVMLHGYGAGKSFWLLNLPTLSERFPNTRFYSLDLLGMGCSAHTFNMSSLRTPGEAESYFISSLETWRSSLGLERMMLCGHSFGGYLASCYALRYPERVEHLVLVSPVGMPVPPTIDATSAAGRGGTPPKVRAPWWAQRYGLVPIMRFLWQQHVTLSQILHLLGPFGLLVFKWIIRRRFGHIASKHLPLEALANYTYHLNAGAVPGHRGLNLLLKPGAHAYDPLLPRLKKGLKLGVSLIYGAYDWMEVGAGRELVDSVLDVGSHFAELIVIPEAGHQMYLENAEAFNDAFTNIIKKVEALMEMRKKNAGNNTQEEEAVEGGIALQ